MRLLPLLDLPLYVSFVLLLMAGLLLLLMTFGGSNSTSMRNSLLNKESREQMLREFRNHELAFGGMIGIMVGMVRIAIVMALIGVVCEAIKLVVVQ